MSGSERKAAAKVVDAVFSTAAVAETRVGEEREEKGGSELGASATTGLTEDWEARTEKAFARKGGTSRGRRQPMAAAENGVEAEGGGRRCWAWMQGRRRRRGRQETRKEGDGGSASAASRRKQRRKRPRSMAATTSWEGGTGGLMKTETRPTATEKSEGREDPHVVGDGKEEEDTATARRKRIRRPQTPYEKGGGVCGGGREGRKGDGRRWRKREEREKRQGGRRWKRGRRGRSRGRRQRSASKSGDAGGRRDNGGREKFFFVRSFGTQGIRHVLSQPTSILHLL